MFKDDTLYGEGGKENNSSSKVGQRPIQKEYIWAWLRKNITITGECNKGFEQLSVVYYKIRLCIEPIKI